MDENVTNFKTKNMNEIVEVCKETQKIKKWIRMDWKAILAKSSTDLLPKLEVSNVCEWNKYLITSILNLFHKHYRILIEISHKNQFLNNQMFLISSRLGSCGGFCCSGFFSFANVGLTSLTAVLAFGTVWGSVLFTFAFCFRL